MCSAVAFYVTLFGAFANSWAAAVQSHAFSCLPPANRRRTGPLTTEQKAPALGLSLPQRPSLL